MEWLTLNWEWVLLGFMILEKIVKMSPSDKDDILLDVIIEGLTKIVKGNKKWLKDTSKDKLRNME